MSSNSPVRLPASVAVARDFVKWGRLVKFSHSIFALPFALSMFVIVARAVPVTGAQLAWIIAALVSARTAAMGFNRLIDSDIDALNPRTNSREIPSGTVSPRSALHLVIVSSAAFLLFAAMLGMHCLILAPLVLGWLFFYSGTKRFTDYAHLVLGVALALAPGGVWYALTGDVAILPLYLMAGVALWVGGFDILYSCQDVAFDAAQNLRSVPVRYGVPAALRIARLMHALAFAFFVLFGLAASLGVPYFIGLAVFGLIIASQHFIVSAADLSRIDAAFFTRNGIASVVYFAAVLADAFF